MNFLTTPFALAHADALIQAHLMHQLMLARFQETGAEGHREALEEIREHIKNLQHQN